jgi:hypothetical protein
LTLRNVEDPECIFDWVLEESHSIKERSLYVSGIEVTDDKFSTPEIIIEAFLGEVKRIGLVDEQEVLILFSLKDPLILAQSLSMYQDGVIKVDINQEHWRTSSPPKRWYILYHELGHDVLNLEHTGFECRMMQPISDREYSWDEFMEGRSEMFLYWLKQKDKN